MNRCKHSLIDEKLGAFARISSASRSVDRGDNWIIVGMPYHATAETHEAWEKGIFQHINQCIPNL